MQNRCLSEKEKEDLEMQIEDSKKDSAPPAYPDPVVDQLSAPTVSPTAIVMQAPVILPGVIVAQPTGMWKKPWNSLSWCDSEVCSAAWYDAIYTSASLMNFTGFFHAIMENSRRSLMETRLMRVPHAIVK